MLTGTGIRSARLWKAKDGPNVSGKAKSLHEIGWVSKDADVLKLNT